MGQASPGSRIIWVHWDRSRRLPGLDGGCATPRHVMAPTPTACPNHNMERARGVASQLHLAPSGSLRWLQPPICLHPLPGKHTCAISVLGGVWRHPRGQPRVPDLRCNERESNASRNIGPLALLANGVGRRKAGARGSSLRGSLRSSALSCSYCYVPKAWRNLGASRHQGGGLPCGIRHHAAQRCGRQHTPEVRLTQAKCRVF